MELQVKPIPTIGTVYAHWRVVTGPIRKPHGSTTWFCQCQCGKVKEVRQAALMSGASKSCGCRRNEGQPPKVVSEETKALLRARRSVQAPPNPNGTKLHKYTEEQRKKMSDAATKRWALQRQLKEQGVLK